MFAQAGPYIRPALINGSAGIVAFGPDGRPFSVMGFIVIDGQIGAIDALVDPVRLRVLDVSMLV